MVKARILVVDDEESICELVKVSLVPEFDISIANNGQEAIDVFKRDKVNLIILDLMLPGLSGLDLCRIFRENSNVPIIILTAKGEDVDKIVGLELGADDYVTKPFNPRELLARARAILRRSTNFPQGNTEVINFSGIEINRSSQTVSVLGHDVELTSKEFEVLWLFASNPGIVFSRERLIQKIWGFDYLGDTRAIDSTIKRLRRKLESVLDAPIFIHTVWGVGYKFEVTAR